MKKMSKLLSITLAILMVITIIPITASAAASGTCGDNLTWTYNSSNGYLTISGTGVMDDYKTNNRPWESYEDKIKTVVIEDGVTTIGEYTFYDCGKLVTVTLPDSVTTIGECAFKKCISLESVNIPNGITTISPGIFNLCEKLTEITLPDSVTEIGEYAFAGCYGLTEMIIPDSVTIIGYYAFGGCDALTSVTIGSSVAKIDGSAFYSCKSLTTITIPKNVATIGNRAFADCITLTNIMVDKDNQYFVNDEYGVLFNKDKTMLMQYPTGNTRTSYTIPNGVTTISEYAFYDCITLISIALPDSIRIIERSAFSDCEGITNLIIPDGVTTIGESAFRDCSSLKDITIPNSVITIGGYAITTYSTLIHYGGTEKQWKQLMTNNTEAEKYYLKDNMVYCTDMTVLPSGSCGDNLTWTYDIVTGILTISGTGDMYNFDTHPISATDAPWSVYINVIKKIIIDDGVTSIGDYAFYYCKSATSIIIPINITSMGDEAFKYSGVTDVYYEGTLEQWENYFVYPNGIMINLNPPFKDATIHYNYHIHRYNSSIITAPTCTEQGYTTYTCECGDNYVDNYVDATGHCHTSEITTPATHTTTGVMTYTCSCGDTYTEVIAKLEKHNYESVVTAPTCTEQGYTTYTCECGDSYVADYVDALGHTEETIPAVAPTCTETGLTAGVECSVCGETLTEQKELPANGHTPANAVEENYVAPTCTANGSKDVVVYCSVCDEEISRETETIEATGHADNDGDGYCDECDKQLCDHRCHKNGFIWKIIRFINKIIGTNKYCECGIAHY